MITGEQIKQLEIFVMRSVEINEAVVKGLVPRLIKNFTVILKRVPDQKFFRRQYTWFEDFARKNILARALEYIGGVYFTSPTRGEIIIRFFESFFVYLRSTNIHKPAKRDIWDWSKEHHLLNLQRQKAIATGDKQTGREITVQIRQLETEAEVFLKRAEAGR